MVTDQKNDPEPKFFREFALVIIIFLVSLFFIITFSNPGIFINDEWITANQLFQLNSGHQVVINEGMYGTPVPGEIAEYFIGRGNILQYTLMLPVVSLPVLRLFGLFGDNFRFFVVVLWSFLPLFIGLLVGMYYPRYGRIKGVSWVWPTIFLSFILFIVNIFFYYPFPFTDTNAPKEVAAIVFTNHVLFALTAVILFQCAMLMYSQDKWKALFAAMLVIVNSSFLFWAGNSKDHILVAFLFSLVILFFIRYVLYRKFTDGALGFIAIGLLTWARPEVGISVFLLSAAFILLFSYFYSDNIKDKKYSVLRSVCLALFIIPGIVPFLINNYIVTGSPFNPTFFAAKTVNIISTTVNASTGNISSIVVGGVMQNPLPMSGVLNTIISFFTYSPVAIVSSLPRVLFWPENGNMGLLTVCPLAIFAVLTLIFVIRKKSSPVDSPLVIYFTLMTFAIFFAYITLMPLISSDKGIVPDMRWLSPVYIPLGLMGTLSVFTILKSVPVKDLLKKYIALSIICVPVFFLLLIVLQPFGGIYTGYSIFYEILIYTVIGLLFIASLAWYKGLIRFRYVAVGILFLLAIPLSWQMMMVFLYSAIKFNGYPFWIPIVEQFFNSFIIVRDVSSVHLSV